MTLDSKIEWTDATWNPWRGCDKVSPGCAHCYMFRDQRRYGRDPSVVVRAADNTFFAPLKAKKWRELPAGSMVFTCSWSDWFHEDADPWRDEAWEIIRERPDLRWQILTKRPERMADHLPADWGDGWEHVWLGVSIENRRFIHRADVLRETPAFCRFISAEPLLGPLVATLRSNAWPCMWWGRNGELEATEEGDFGLSLELIDWLIVGGESGPRHRPIREEWVRDLRSAADAAETAFFLKQWGGPRPESNGRTLDGRTYDAMPVAA